MKLGCLFFVQFIMRDALINYLQLVTGGEYESHIFEIGGDHQAARLRGPPSSCIKSFVLYLAKASNR